MDQVEQRIAVISAKEIELKSDMDKLRKPLYVIHCPRTTLV